MQRLSHEFKVGLFVLVALVLVVGSYLWSFDGVRPNEDSYTLRMTVGSADGLFPGTPVRIAGVEVGSIEQIAIEGDHAALLLRVREAYKLPVDSTGQLKATGLLGDYFVRLYPGTEDDLLEDGDTIRTRDAPGDIDTITRNLEAISDDIAAMTKVLREVVEDRNNREHAEATLANIDALTLEVRLLAERNRGEIDAIVDSVRRLSEALEGYTRDIADDVDEELDKVKDLTDDLDRAAEDLASITGKVDRGEGTIGALINDRETVDNLNRTVKDAGDGIRSIFGLRPEFYYTGRFYMGTQPTDLEKFPTGNELAWSGANTIGLRLRGKEDFWYLFELVDHPQGKISQRTVYSEQTGQLETRWIRTRGYRITFMVEKRWGPASLRLGLKEDGGGVGATFYAVRDRLQIGADVFAFAFGSFPAVEEAGIPNTRVFVRYEPWRNVFFEAGAEQILLGAKNGFFTGFLGVGFYFRDNNLRGALTAVPLGSL
ncbi:MAG: MCE family protein [Alphaproteobacteria bacterium]|nr:MCE family protein [Alphaproteobacteria bacterium]